MDSGAYSKSPAALARYHRPVEALTVTPRIAAIDAGRAIACVAIVLIHTASSTHFAPPSAAAPTGTASIEPGHIIDQLARFGVPYFFLATGYFFRSKPKGDSEWARLKAVFLRLAPPFFFWALIFNLLNLENVGVLATPGFWVRFLLQGGSAYHLWYLPGVACGLALLIVTGRVLSIYGQVVLCLALFGIGLAMGPYQDVITGKPPNIVILHLARDVCFGPIFIAMGAWLRQSAWRPGFHVAVLLFLGGAMMQLAECFMIMRVVPDAEFGRDFVLSTVPFGAGAFLMALTWPRPHHVPAPLVKIGILGLGFYAVHPLFIDVLGRLLAPHDLTMRLIVALATVPLSYGTAWLLALWRPTRRVVL